MLALAVVAHPSPTSFSHAMADAARTVLAEHGFELAWHDLYAEGFNPVQPTGELQNTTSTDALVEQHCGELARAQLIFVFHPNWWGQPPAILKGWIDRVFRLGTAYGYPPGVPPEGVPGGLLQARRALVFNTSNTPPERDVVRRMHGPMSGSSAAHRVRWLAGVKALTQEAAALVAAQAA